MDFLDKVVVLTGAGSGIGREMALQLIHSGARVAGVDLHETGLNETRELLPENLRDKMRLYTMNIVDKASVETLPDLVSKTLGNADILINNAGIIQPFVKINQLEYEAIMRVMNVNFFGMVHMIKAFLPHLLTRPESYIVNISSMGGFLPVPGQSVYGASKAAVKLFTEGLQSELAYTKTKVMIVFPGAMATHIAENSGVKTPDMPAGTDQPQIKALPADKAADMILRGIEKNKKRLFVGKDSRMMDILYRFSPNYATGMITRKMRSLLSD